MDECLYDQLYQGHDILLLRMDRLFASRWHYAQVDIYILIYLVCISVMLVKLTRFFFFIFFNQGRQTRFVDICVLQIQFVFSFFH